MGTKYNPDIHHRRSIRLPGYDYSQAGAYFVTICVQNRECLFGTIDDYRLILNPYGEIVNHWWQTIPTHFVNVAIDAYVIMPNHFHGIVAIGTDMVAAPNSAPNAPNGRGAVVAPNSAPNAPNGRGAVVAPNPTPNAPNGRGAVVAPNSAPNAPNGRGAVVAPNSAPTNPVPEPEGGITPTLRDRPTLGKIVAYFKYQTTKAINQLRNTTGQKVWQRNYYEHIIRNDISLERLRQYIQNNPRQWAVDQLHPQNPSRW